MEPEEGKAHAQEEGAATGVDSPAARFRRREIPFSPEVYQALMEEPPGPDQIRAMRMRGRVASKLEVTEEDRRVVAVEKRVETQLRRAWKQEAEERSSDPKIQRNHIEWREMEYFERVLDIVMPRTLGPMPTPATPEILEQLKAAMEEASTKPRRRR